MGTGYIKAGFSGEDLPRSITSTVVSEQKIEIDPTQQTTTNNENMKPKTIWSVGKKAFEAQSKCANSENLTMHMPIHRGIFDFERE